MRVRPDNAHCMKHACSYRMDERCPYCALEASRAAPVGNGFWSEQRVGERSSGGLQGPSGCYRRAPTCRD